MRSHKKSKSAIGFFLAVVTGMVVGVSSYWVANEQIRRSVESEPAQVVTVFIGDLTTRVSARGQVLPQRQANVTLGIAGRVAHVFVQDGDSG